MSTWHEGMIVLEKEIEMLRPKDFMSWVETAQVGEEIVYHEGSTVARNGGRTMTGQAAWDAALAGDVMLYRRRIGYQRYSFYARRVSPTAGRALRPFDMAAEK